ncbi:MAG: glucose-1-phosphate adenylyltransferase [Candidatus Margulisiibacteriota bacterium]|nr:MAG: glucose-1-phosphate adenylyltransferase [Candidatus Margulisbacteria bacterium GWD2_39_127]OGI01283.1 MAG: glucose-1-phosphate adenylyltransferase [Candidatus Margulisbacteria bacterium GWF2_38_17]OGI09227.1 MAG: glucose-1-phosphate adenylyltransferase [Candidatus Margulisbacteria bacterium GWE2_39_32]PZM83760.1 MAG: glucose-1-phosphate adenylyltransferase [Candidatus Margulisiibacteriota bacterium]HAR63048.1 glucose-1-phosphate adenylyltransferase [Candidatus Margulisiibacteriota bacte
MENVLSIILGGGKGTRLYPLTKYRSKPAVPLGGKYRLVDIPVSNCINSSINKIFVITQYNSESLNRSVFQTYKFDIFSKGYIRILAAEQSPENVDWLQGTADAIRKNIKHISDLKVDYILILSGDQLYRMDYRQIIEKHIESKADATLALTVSEIEKASSFGLAKIDEHSEIKAFVEKPKDPAIINEFKVPDAIKLEEGLPLDKDYVLANMGIYVFSVNYLRELMENTIEPDFGRDIFPGLLGKKKLVGFVHKGYWEDIGTIKAFYEANLDLASPLPKFNFYDMEYPIYAQPLFLPPSKFEASFIENSLVSDGCVLNRVTIRNSMIGIRTIVDRDSYIEESILMGDDYYQTEMSKVCDDVKMGIGRNCVIKKAIIDKNARIGNNVKIINPRNVQNYEGENYMIREGIVVIEKYACIPDNTVI